MDCHGPRTNPKPKPNLNLEPSAPTNPEKTLKLQQPDLKSTSRKKHRNMPVPGQRFSSLLDQPQWGFTEDGDGALGQTQLCETSWHQIRKNFRLAILYRTIQS